jgi:hypothetical protein
VPMMSAANTANSVNVRLGVNMRTSFSMSNFSRSGYRKSRADSIGLPVKSRVAAVTVVKSR